MTLGTNRSDSPSEGAATMAATDVQPEPQARPRVNRAEVWACQVQAAQEVLATAPDRTAPRDSIAFSRWRCHALGHAAACRELWRQHHDMSSKRLMRELDMHRYHLSEECRPYRSDHLREVSRWYVRMITTELARRPEVIVARRAGALGAVLWVSTRVVYLWPGPGSRLELIMGETSVLIGHPSASGSYETERSARAAVAAFISSEASR